MTKHPMQCDCCEVSYELIRGGQSRQVAVIRYDGKAYTGWDRFGAHVGLSGPGAYMRAKAGKCFKNRAPQHGQPAKRKNVHDGAGVAELMGGWR